MRYEFSILCFPEILKIVSPVSTLLSQTITEAKECNFYFEILQGRLNNEKVVDRTEINKYLLVCFQCGEKSRFKDSFCPNCGESIREELEVWKMKGLLESYAPILID